MIAVAVPATKSHTKTLPKNARLLKKSDFRFRPFKKVESEHFQFVYSPNGRGRIGISISKKVLKRAVWRNRIRRLLREAFRHHKVELKDFDLHVIALPALLRSWETLKRQDLEAELIKLSHKSEK